MKPESKTKAQLVEELSRLKTRVQELERKEVEEMLQESEARLKAQYQGSPIPTFTWRKNGETFELVDFNQAAERATGGKAKTFLGKSAAEMYQDRTEILEDIHRCFRGKKVIKRELMSRHFMPGRTMAVTYAFVPPDLIMVHAEDITERKRTEEALRDSEETFRTLAENANDGIFIAVGEGIQAYANRRAGEITGYSVAELLKSGIRDLVHPDDAQKVMERYRKRLAGEPAPPQYEVNIIRKDRKTIPIELTAAKTFWQGEPADLVIIRDITERKKLDETLRKNELAFRTFFEATPIGTGLVVNRKIVKVNPALCRMTGYSADELEGQSLRIAYRDDEEFERVGKILFEQVERDGLGITEAHLRFKSGEEIEGLICLSPLDPRNPSAGYIATAIDITERKRSQEALQESEEKYRNLVERSNDGIGIGQDGVLRFANKRLAQMTGYLNEELVGKPFTDFFMPDEIPKIFDFYKRRMDGESLPSIYETALQHKDGSRIEVEVNAGIVNYKGKPADLVLVRDITERKRVEEALLESEEKFRNVFDNSSIGMSITSIDGSVYVNQALNEMLGYTKEELSVLKWQDFTHPDDIELTQDHIEQLLSGEKNSVRFIKRYIRKDGSTLWGDLNTVLQKDKPGNPLYYISGLVDITERRRWEALIERTMRETRIRFEVSQALVGKETEDEVLDTLIQQAGIYPQALVAILTFKRAETEIIGTLRRIDFFSSDLTQNVPLGTSFPSSEFSIINRYTAGMPFVSDNVLTDEGLDPSVRDLISRAGGRSFLAFLLEEGKELLGLIVAVAKPIGYFNKERKHLYQALADQGAVALRAAHLRGQIRESQQRFQGLVETLSDWIWEVDQNGVYTYISPKIRDLLGYQPEELLGKTPYYLMPFEEAGLVTGTFGRLLALQQPLGLIEITCRHKSGRLVVFETKGEPFFDAGGNFKGYRGINRDITYRKEAEKALRQAEEKYRAIVENAVEGIFQSTADGKFLMANSALARFHGYDSPEELMADISNIGEQLYVHPEDRRHYGRILADKEVVKGFETQFYTKDRKIKWGSMNVRSVKGQAGQVLYYEGTNEDITARKEVEERLQKTLEKLRKAMGGIIQAMALTVETRDPYTAGHQRRVADLARAIAQEMGLPEDQVDGIRMAGIVHDLGKISIPAEILSKPSKLSDLEYSLIKVHPQISYDILKDIDFTWPVAEIVFQHHERINGSGYPLGLSGEAIHLEARILAVADVVEAIASHRPYRPAYGIDVALEEISKNRGVLYDPEAVEACLRLFREKGFKFE